MIDYDNNIVFMGISHKELINRLTTFILDKYLDKTYSVPDDLTVEEFLDLKNETTHKNWEEYLKLIGEEESKINNETFETFYKEQEENRLEYLKNLEENHKFSRNFTKEEVIKWKEKVFNYSKMLSYHEYEKYSNLDSEKKDIYFQKETNTIQVFTSLVNPNMPKVLTFRIKNKENSILMNKLNELNIKYDIHTVLTNKDFIVLNGTGIVEGEIYFPKPEEEDIPKNKILIIPTASEEYFLPALSQMAGSGCIITEKSSKTAHLVINSKEFSFNIILMEKASKYFKENDILKIDLDKEKFLN